MSPGAVGLGQLASGDTDEALLVPRDAVDFDGMIESTTGKIHGDLKQDLETFMRRRRLSTKITKLASLKAAVTIEHLEFNLFAVRYALEERKSRLMLMANPVRT